MFTLLTSVSHVGPRLAMTVLSGLEVEELVVALERGEVARLTRIHGVGRKTAERLVLELRDKVKVLPTLGARAGRALRRRGRARRSGLGAGEPRATVRRRPRPRRRRRWSKLGPAELEALLREALRSLRTGS